MKKQNVSLLRRFKHNKSALFAIIILFLMFTITIFASTFSPYDPAKSNTRARLSPPSFPSEDGEPPHYFGQDTLVRTVCRRLIYVAGASLNVAFVLPTLV